MISFLLKKQNKKRVALYIGKFYEEVKNHAFFLGELKFMLKKSEFALYMKSNYTQVYTVFPYIIDGIIVILLHNRHFRLVFWV